jgi:L,D-peptidoglycan transpeptidase YkuD (ErfK/YbiS/YcfS/YnhG family)
VTSVNILLRQGFSKINGIVLLPIEILLIIPSMNLLVKKNHLFVKGEQLQCAIGLNGLTENKREGDLSTPIGIFHFNKIYYRADRLSNMKFIIDSAVINKNDGWCDDQKSELYNRYIQFPFQESAERLYRDDHIYDILCVLDYNTSPVIPGLGSAIFLHVAKSGFLGTEGCVAIEREALIEIATNLTADSTIVIEN